MTEPNLIDEIKKDHQELIAFYDRYKNAVSTEESNKWFHQFVWELSRHSVAEELVLYPLLESLSQKGKELADKARKDHHAVKELLYAASKETNVTLFDEKMNVIMKDLAEHIQNEENEDLVYLSDNVSPKNLSRAGKMFTLKKKIAPTRPHPMIPEKPVALEAALGLLVAPIDKFRDLFSSFPENPEDAV